MSLTVENLNERWRSLVAELRADPRVTLTQATLHPPSPDGEAQARALGLPITADLSAYLAFCDGMQLEWAVKDFDAKFGGSIEVPSLAILGDPERWPGPSDSLDYPLESYGVSYESPRGLVTPFDFFRKNPDNIELAFWLPRGDSLDVFVSDDDIACITDTLLLSFGEYLDLVFRAYGSPMARSALQRGAANRDAQRVATVAPGISTKRYSLDALIDLTTSAPNYGQIEAFFR